MSKLKFLKQTALDRLRSNIGPNQKRYAEDASFLSDYFGGSNWYVESNIVAPDSIELHIPTSKSELFDLENTRIVYSALKHLTPVQASDPRLWAYFTHVSHWEYMRSRWPVERMRQRNYRVDRGGSLDYRRAAAQAVGVSSASR